MQNIAYRNVVFLNEESFDCEIEHPLFGWIPFTASANDVEIYGRQLWAAIKESLTNEQ